MDTEGSASPLAFIGAGLLFLGVVGAVFTVVLHQVPASTAAQAVTAGHGLEAHSILERFVLGTNPLTLDDPGLADGPGILNRTMVSHLMQGTHDDNVTKVRRGHGYGTTMTHTNNGGNGNNGNNGNGNNGNNNGNGGFNASLYYDYAEVKESLAWLLRCAPGAQPCLADPSCLASLPCDTEHRSDFQVTIESDTESCVFGPSPSVGSVLAPAVATAKMKDAGGALQQVRIRVLAFDSLFLFGPSWQATGADRTAHKVCLQP